MPLTYVKCVSLLESLGTPAEALPAPKSIPAKCQVKEEALKNSQYDIPTLADLNVDESLCGPCIYPGGETEGLDRMEKSLSAKVSVVFGSQIHECVIQMREKLIVQKQTRYTVNI